MLQLQVTTPHIFSEQGAA